MALLLVEALGGQVAIVLIVLCILNLFVNMYTRIKKNKATKKWLEITMSKWKSEFRRLHLKRNGESLEMISNGPLCSTMFATGRQNLKHVCVELEVPPISDLVTPLIYFMMSRPFEYTITMQVSLKQNSSNKSILVGIFPIGNAKKMLLSNWALSNLTTVTNIMGIPEENYVVFSECKQLASSILDNKLVAELFQNSRGKDAEGRNLPVSKALMRPVVNYIVITDSFIKEPENESPLFAEEILVTMNATIPSPLQSIEEDIKEASAGFILLIETLLAIVDNYHKAPEIPNKLFSDILESRRSAHSDPKNLRKKEAEERAKQIANDSKKNEKLFLEKLTEEERKKYYDDKSNKKMRKKHIRVLK